ncbi:MAG: hypothetical protein A3G93_09330 [Nitrospinae bacterium RIFCSPLOWO2_12_FULL_45_22]|nr:MAG: hypothetical protein A3G93_09330 [Nitrospinae bacterium RIFCSPLOWO2_12_FULL_45_22]
MEHLFMTSVKGIEYIIAVIFLFTFIVFWRVLNIGGIPAMESLSVAAGGVVKKIGDMVDWFLVPDRLYFHPGHAWVKVEDGDVVRVGMDDFAQKLVGKIDALNLPKVGSTVSQGERGWTVHLGSKSVDLLSPIDGKIVAVNEALFNAPKHINEAPYEEGWLMKVKVPRLSANLKNLLSGNLARRWMEEVSGNLRLRLGANLGLVYQDGGLPVEGLAKNLDRDKWDEIAKEFFLTLD